MKTAERDEARTLRREQGQSIKEIARALGVSTSSVSHWVRDIELTTEQIEVLRARNPILNGQMAGAKARTARARLLRSASQTEGRAAALRGDPMHAGGCMLFWADGSRHRNAVHFTNSDPVMVASSPGSSVGSLPLRTSGCGSGAISTPIMRSVSRRSRNSGCELSACRVPA
ncbi:MAG: helix-turn-helix domain-containing protein [Gaiellaceae bacterium]